MATLREDVIKLASSVPELRKDLLKILERTAAASKQPPSDRQRFMTLAVKAGASSDVVADVLDKLELHDQKLRTLSDNDLIEYAMEVSVEPDDMNALLQALDDFKAKK